MNAILAFLKRNPGKAFAAGYFEQYISREAQSELNRLVESGNVTRNTSGLYSLAETVSEVGAQIFG